MSDIDFEVVENFVDESYGGFDGLVVEIGYLWGGGSAGGVGGTEHAGGNILGGKGTDGPAAVGVERGFGGADLLHEVGAESWSEEFGVVEFVGLREEGVVEGGGEVEDAVDHWTWNNQTVRYLYFGCSFFLFYQGGDVCMCVCVCKKCKESNHTKNGTSTGFIDSQNTFGSHVFSDGLWDCRVVGITFSRQHFFVMD